MAIPSSCLLFTHCLIPYDINDEMTADERNYNCLHSCTQIVVENDFGMLKNQFRRLRAALNQKGNLENGWHPEENEKQPALKQLE